MAKLFFQACSFKKGHMADIEQDVFEYRCDVIDG